MKSSTVFNGPTVRVKLRAMVIESASCMKIDGKTVSFRRIGTGDRKILFFHGFPGSSIQIELFRRCLSTHDLEVLCIDRPGYGQTEPGEGSPIRQVIDLCRRLISDVGWKNCDVFTVSGGTPFGLSFAAAHPELVRRTTVISGLGPIGEPAFGSMMGMKSLVALRTLPLVPQSWIELATRSIRNSPITGDSDPGRLPILKFFLSVSKEDEEVMGDPLVSRTLRTAVQEALLQKGAGPKSDARAFFERWSACLSELPGTATFWHGTNDRIISARMSEWMSMNVRAAQMRLVPAEGHYSLSIRRIETILGL